MLLFTSVLSHLLFLSTAATFSPVQLLAWGRWAGRGACSVLQSGESQDLFCPSRPRAHSCPPHVLMPGRWRVFNFSPFAVFAIPCYMASLVRCAPLPEGSTLVEDPQFQEILLRSRSLVQKILLSIPDTHKSCIYTEVRYSTCAPVARRHLSIKCASSCCVI